VRLGIGGLGSDSDVDAAVGQPALLAAFVHHCDLVARRHEPPADVAGFLDVKDTPIPRPIPAVVRLRCQLRRLWAEEQERLWL
jgi:hypothetical protein